MRGYYLMHRGWLDHPALGSDQEPFCRRAAWAWMIEEAAYDPRKVRIGGRIVELRRGQFSHSLRHMADAWGWGHERCRRFLAELRSERMIETATETGQFVVTICNYDRFQCRLDGRETANETATETGIETGARQHEGEENQINSTQYEHNHKVHDDFARQQTRQERDRSETIYKEIKEGKESKESSSKRRAAPHSRGAIESEFAEFYQAFPRHVGRAAAYRKYVVARNQADAETLLVAAKRFAEISSGKEPQYVAHPATWLHQGRWQDDELQRPDAPASSGPNGPAPKPEDIWPDLKETRH